MRGIAFGTTGTSLTFSSWANKAACTIGGTDYRGFQCVDAAIQNLTLQASNGIIKGPGRLANVQMVQHSPSVIRGYYTTTDDGQGPSCTADEPPSYDDPPNNCNYSSANIPSDVRFLFPGRGVKVTCKNTCNANNNRNVLDVSAWAGLVTQLSQFLSSNNLFAAHFAVKRRDEKGTLVVTRCRVTIPNVSQFPMDPCPDVIPGYGNDFVDEDTEPAN